MPLRSHQLWTPFLAETLCGDAERPISVATAPTGEVSAGLCLGRFHFLLFLRRHGRGDKPTGRQGQNARQVKTLATHERSLCGPDESWRDVIERQSVSIKAWCDRIEKSGEPMEAQCGSIKAWRESIKAPGDADERVGGSEKPSREAIETQGACAKRWRVSNFCRAGVRLSRGGTLCVRGVPPGELDERIARDGEGRLPQVARTGAQAGFLGRVRSCDAPSQRVTATPRRRKVRSTKELAECSRGGAPQPLSATGRRSYVLRRGVAATAA